MKDEKGISLLIALAGAVVFVQVAGGVVAYATGAWAAAWAAVLVATLALVAGMVLAVERRWVGPVRRLAGTAGEMARGNWSAHTVPGGADGVTELAVQVNAMAAKARQQLAGLEEQWRVVRALVDTLPDPVMLVEGHRRVTVVNSAAGHLLGTTPARAAGRWLGEVVKDRALLETFEAVPAVVGGDAGGDAARPVERQVVVERDGQRVTYQAVAVRTADGVLLVLRDVTALAETVRIKTDFVANASHELRTPIAAIKAAFETLRDVYGEDPGQADRCVRIIDGHLRRLEEMLRDLLDLSRLESAELTVEPTAVRPAEVFAAARGALGEMAADKGVELRASLDGAGPFATDVRLLNMVVKNLVENAIKFTPAGGTVEVSVARPDGGGAVVLSVRDTGAGIPPEHVNRVFERFYQVDPARTGGAGRGTGLGLAIVKHAVGAMGGTVSIESKVGEGTTVTCTLPQPAGWT